MKKLLKIFSFENRIVWESPKIDLLNMCELVEIRKLAHHITDTQLSHTEQHSNFKLFLFL